MSEVTTTLTHENSLDFWKWWEKKVEQPAAAAPRLCPGCGRCPTCGQGGPQPWYPTYPTYPWYPFYPTYTNWDPLPPQNPNWTISSDSTFQLNSKENG